MNVHFVMRRTCLGGEGMWVRSPTTYSTAFINLGSIPSRPSHVRCSIKIITWTLIARIVERFKFVFEIYFSILDKKRVACFRKNRFTFRVNEGKVYRKLEPHFPAVPLIRNGCLLFRPRKN